MGIQVSIGHARWRPWAGQQGHLVLGPPFPGDWKVGLLPGGAPLPGEGPTSPARRGGVERGSRGDLGEEGASSGSFNQSRLGWGGDRF